MHVLPEPQRRAIIERACRIDATTRPPEQMRQRIRGRVHMLPVIEPELEALLPNPRSHRVRAQLESHPLAERIARDPGCPEAVAAVRALLAACPHYKGLLKNVRSVGQAEPGLCTEAGVLINANCRWAVKHELREREPHVAAHRTLKVALLPAGLSDDVLAELEIDLQMAQQYRGPYSYTNDLLVVRELLTERGLGPVAIALRMGYAASDERDELKKGVERVEAATRQLALIRELQARCGGRLPLIFFDSWKVAIAELDRECEAVRRRTGDPRQVAGVRDMRLTALLVGIDYRPMREIKADFLGDYLARQLERDPALRPYLGLFRPAPAPVGDAAPLPGLELFAPPAAAPAGLDAAAALHQLAAAWQQPALHLAGFDRPIPREQLERELGGAIRKAIRLAKVDRKARRQKDRPLYRLDKVLESLGHLDGRMADYLADPTFNRAGYAERLGRVADVLARLQAELNGGAAS